MAAFQLCADSTTVVLNGQIINDFAEGDIVSISPKNPSTGRTNGNNGNVIIKQRVDKDAHTIVLKVIKYSASDVWLNGQLGQCPPVLLNGSIKESFTKDGSEGQGSWGIANGSFTVQPSDSYNNQDGQAVVEYTIEANATRNV